MKRKLVEYDAFKKHESDSLSSAEYELVVAEDLLARALGVDEVSLHCFNETNATYATENGTYIHAGYKLDESHIHFDNFTEMVIDQDTEEKASRDLLAGIVENVLENKPEVASKLFYEFMGMPTTRRKLTEGAFDVTVTKLTGPDRKPSSLLHKNRSKSAVRKGAISRKKTERLKKSNPGLKAQFEREGEKAKSKAGLQKQRTKEGQKVSRVFVRKDKKKMNEWNHLCENLFGYVEYKKFGPILESTSVEYDSEGEVSTISVPRSKVRNEQQLLSFNWDTPDVKERVLRGGAKKMSEDNNFIKLLLALKKLNSISDTQGVQESLENIVGNYPRVLYLTQRELARSVAEALSMGGDRRYDDETCNYLAEGILRLAHKTYTDKVNHLMNIVGGEVCEECDAYEAFQEAIAPYFEHLDDQTDVENKVYGDLFEALREVYTLANEQGLQEIKEEADSYLRDIWAVLNREINPDLDLVEEATEWLISLIETNLESSNWNVSNSVHVTVSGDHPQMSKNASHSYTPSKDGSGDWGDSLPALDDEGGSYKSGGAKKMRNNSWGQAGASNSVYPGLNNPYILKPFGDYTMKGEPGVDKSSDATGQWSSGDTWPNLSNPNVPQADNPQMKSDNLVVDQ